MNNRIGLLVVAGLCACGDGTHPTSTSVIGPDGGEVHVGTGASVSIPPGALPDSVAITITSADAAAPSETLEVGGAYVFSPEGTQFAVPVTVTLSFDPNTLQSEDTPADVVIETAPAGTTEYGTLPTSVVDESHVSAETTHFSVFVPTVRRRRPHELDAGIDTNEHADGGVDAMVDAQVACTPVKGPNSAQNFCDFSATCNGHLYKIMCSGISCGCYIDGAAGQTVSNVGTTCFGTTGQPGWGACGFP